MYHKVHASILHVNNVCLRVFVSVCVSDLPLGVAEDDGLCDGQGVVQVTQSVKLPLLSLHSHEELFDPLQSQLVTEGHKHSHRSNGS